MQLHTVGFRAILMGFVATLLAGCAGDGSSGSAQTERGTPASEALRARFPEQAARILDGAPDGAPASQAERVNERGASLLPASEKVRGAASEARGLVAEFPRAGAQFIRFTLPDGTAVHVREAGAHGDAEPAGAAVAYARAGGTSFWTRTPRGYEEWLLLEGGLAYAGQELAAWEVTGAEVRQRGEAVEVSAGEGPVQIRVTAPRAYAIGGREVPVTLAVIDGRISVSADAGGEPVLVDPAWELTLPMVTAHTEHATVLLQDGTALVMGGLGANGLTKATVEVYDPASDAWAVRASMGTPRHAHTATLLADGKVLVTGGFDGNTGLSTTQLYDPLADTWISVASMYQARRYHTATLLLNGRVFVAGGIGAGGGPLNTAETYDPVLDKWALHLASMGASRFHHTATLLLDGRVLLWGGPGLDLFPTQNVPFDIFNPDTSVGESPFGLEDTRQRHTATLLPDGKVLIAGGEINGITLNTTQVFDPLSDSRSSITPLLTARSAHTATLLPNGTVLVAGGSTPIGPGAVATRTTELFHPETHRWGYSAELNEARHSHTATLLPDSRVLVAGGKALSALSSAEAYGTALGDPCVILTDCPSGHCIDGVCCDAACDTGQCDACSIAEGASQNGHCEVLTGTPCEDGFLCTASDTCQAGVCMAGNPVVCEPKNDCQTAQCEHTSGECVDMSKDDGASCAGGVCASGECIETPGAGGGGGGSGGGSGSGAGGNGPPEYYEQIYVQGGCICDMAASRTPGAAGWLAPALLSLWLLRTRRSSARS